MNFKILLPLIWLSIMLYYCIKKSYSDSRHTDGWTTAVVFLALGILVCLCILFNDPVSLTNS